MSEPTAVAEIVGRFRYFEDIKNKYCPTIFQEISEYHPKNQEAPSDIIVCARSMRSKGDTTDEECGKFWKQPVNALFLEKKYAIEQNNKECYIRLCELERECIDKDMMSELAAVKTKREQFERVIRGYGERPLEIFIVPNLFNEEWKKKSGGNHGY